MRTGQRFRGYLCAALGICTLGVAAPKAAADAATRALSTRRYLLAEPTMYTSVLDAFDDAELPDVSVALTFRRTHSKATIARERVAADERIDSTYRNVAQSEQVTNALALDLAAGLYRDLMLFVSLPLVLSDKRALVQMNDAAPSAPVSEPENAAAGNLSNGGSGTRTALFKHDFRSATRSGVPGLDIGVAWGITNQYRDAYLPTWVVRVESRLGLGEALKPCQADYPCTTGVSRGTVRLGLESRWSYRYRWAEPYLGLRYVHEWATTARSRFSPDGVSSALDTALPSRQELTVGAALMAWEDRARFQRISVQVSGQAAYISTGRDYSPLFDALGVSTNPQLAAANESSGVFPFYGLTQVEGHARLRAQLALAAQAAKYIQFRLGLALMTMTPHLLTGAPACVSAAAGPCDRGQANPLYRAVIDLPGQRFMLRGNMSYDLFASARGQF